MDQLNNHLPSGQLAGAISRLLGCNLRGFPGEIQNCLPWTRRARRDGRKAATEDWWVAVLRSRKVTHEAYLGCCKIHRSLRPPSKTLEVYIEVLRGLSHVFSPDGLDNTLL